MWMMGPRAMSFLSANSALQFLFRLSPNLELLVYPQLYPRSSQGVNWTQSNKAALVRGRVRGLDNWEW